MATKRHIAAEERSLKLWLWPFFGVIAGTVLFLALMTLDKSSLGYQMKPSWLFPWQKREAATPLLAGLMGVVAGTIGAVISMTLVAITVAAAQLGPRLIRNFLGNRETKLILSLFVGGVTYLVLLFAAVVNAGDKPFTLQLSLLFGVTIPILIPPITVIFIHRIARLVTTSSLAAAIVSDFISSNHFDAREESFDDKDDSTEVPGIAPQTVISADKSGYVQAIDRHRLIGIAQRYDLKVEITQGSGRFVLRGQSIGNVWCPSRIDEQVLGKITDCIIVGSEQMASDDMEFAITQLVQIALKNIDNDPLAVRDCLNRIGEILAEVDRHPPLPRVMPDEHGIPRLFCESTTFASQIHSSFEQILRATFENDELNMQLLRTIDGLLQVAKSKTLRSALIDEVKTVLNRLQDRKLTDDDDALRTIAKQRWLSD